MGVGTASIGFKESVRTHQKCIVEKHTNRFLGSGSGKRWVGHTNSKNVFPLTKRSNEIFRIALQFQNCRGKLSTLLPIQSDAETIGKCGRWVDKKYIGRSTWWIRFIWTRYTRHVLQGKTISPNTPTHFYSFNHFDLENRKHSTIRNWKRTNYSAIIWHRNWKADHVVAGRRSALIHPTLVCVAIHRTANQLVQKYRLVRWRKSTRNIRRCMWNRNSSKAYTFWPHDHSYDTIHGRLERNANRNRMKHHRHVRLDWNRPQKSRLGT